jgi:hypothetical protein
MLGDHPVEHRLGVVEQRGRALADHRVGEDGGIIAGQLPGAEEGRPVDRGAKVAKRPFAELVDAGTLGRRGLALRVVGKGIGAGLVERRELAVAAPGAGLADILIILGRLRDQGLALGLGA